MRPAEVLKFLLGHVDGEAADRGICAAWRVAGAWATATSSVTVVMVVSFAPVSTAVVEFFGLVGWRALDARHPSRLLRCAVT
jgi:hypothetical protein